MTREPGRERQSEIYLAGLAGLAGARPRVPVDPDRLEACARRAMRPRRSPT